MNDEAVPLLDGPRVPPKSGVARSLAVFLHGYGADGNDLIGLARFWADVLPDTAFVSPHAVSPRGDAPFGREWFPLAGIDPALLRSGVLSAAPALDAFLDTELDRWGLNNAALALVGFSQGTMMALHTGPRRKTPIAAIVGYSGLVPAPEFLETEATQRPPVLLVHGDQDDVIPAMATYAAARVLGKLGFQVEWHIRPGLAHGIDEEGLRFGADFLRRMLP